MPEYPQEGCLRGGHIPGAKSVPWAKAIDPETHTFKSAADLRKLYEQDNSLKQGRRRRSPTAGSASGRRTPGSRSRICSASTRCGTTTGRGPSGGTRCGCRWRSRSGAGASSAIAARAGPRAHAGAGLVRPSVESGASLRWWIAVAAARSGRAQRPRADCLRLPLQALGTASRSGPPSAFSPALTSTSMQMPRGSSPAAACFVVRSSPDRSGSSRASTGGVCP